MAFDKSRLPSRHSTQGPERAPQRALMYAAGVPEGGTDLPLVGIFTTWNDGSPCSLQHREQAHAVRGGIKAAGGTPFEFTTISVNDGVSTIIIGANDWAGAWAVGPGGAPMLPVVPGGERQREMAYRFGVNLVMYALTGNYKSDQVHVPAILERLGQ